jgi:Zn-finger nucleic acid-binding protein
MKCPIDSTVDLVMTERGGVEIDYCPSCRGVWLDRGELDKIIDRASAEMAPAPQAPPPVAPPVAQPQAPYPQAPPQPMAPPPAQRWDSSDKWGRSGQGKTSKPKSFLKDMFEF